MTVTQDMSVRLERLGEVLLATVDNPPVNALSHGVRAGLVAAVEALESDPEAKALVILCAGRTFMAGADIREFGKPLADPQLGEVVARLDRCEKPVIAAMHGTALGGGLEVALASSHRIAQAEARLGLPEVKLGLLPGSGGVVRLPRLIGVERALPMITEGHQIGAAEALEIGLVDEVAKGDLREAALAAANRLIAGNAAPRRTSDLPVPAFDPAFLAESRSRLARRYPGQDAPMVAVDLIEMVARTPFADAVEKEYAACRALVASPQSRALRHLFAAERAAQKVEGLPEGTLPREIRKVAVVGPGVMGRGITVSLLDGGLDVVLLGLSDASLTRARDAIAKVYAGQVKRGAMSDADVAARLARLVTTTAYTGLADVDLAIETVTESLPVKQEVLARLDSALPSRAIIVTNTSFLDIEALADAVSRPEDFAGMHFFNPANVMKLLENVRARRTSPEVLATIMALGRRLGKVAVLVGRSEGFVANRMLSKRSREAQFLLEDGATPSQVDRVLAGFGFPIGPFALADLAGMDVMAAARAARIDGMTPRERACDIVDKLAAAGRLGQKSGAGYYRYGEDRKPQPDPEVDALLARHRDERGRAVREIADAEILERCLYAMVNEAAKLIDEGAVARASDIDVIWTSGFGWPRHLGGPMFWADRIGLPAIKAALDRYSALVGAEYFAPAPLIERLAAEGRGFLD